MKIRSTDLLLIVDVLNDFVTGSLAVPNAKSIIPIINKYIEKFEYILFCKEKHPVNHCSFVAQGGPWPPHCVADTYGAELYSDLNVPEDLWMIYKGTLTDKEAYSAFEATQLLTGTPSSPSYDSVIIDKLDLSSYLRLMGIKRLFICGLATEYCIKATVLDATKNKKFNGPVFLLVDAIKAVKTASENASSSMREMLEAGVAFITLDM